jgi:hypothetical protein
MKSNLFVLLFCSLLASSIYANTLIITRGPTCCAMGTYLANTIKLFDNSYYFLSQNDLFNDTCFRLLNKIFPYEMNVIGNVMDQENIIPSIVYGHTYFKDVIPAARLQAIEAIERIRLFLNDSVNDPDDIFIKALNLAKSHIEMANLAYHAACEDNIVWERRTFSDWDYDTKEIENLFENVVNVITYCHPTKMIKEWLVKDSEATAEKKAFSNRHAKQVVTSFFKIFQPVGKYKEAVVILTKDEFDHIIEEVASYITFSDTVPTEKEDNEEEIFTQSEFTIEELWDFKAQMYEKFDFDNVDYVGLAPILYYDVLLSSKQDCVKFVQEFIGEYCALGRYAEYVF